MLNFSTQRTARITVLPVFLLVMDTILDHIAFDIDEIKTCLDKLLTKYSTGPDYVQTVLLKKLCGTLSMPLAPLFQKLLETSKIPKMWKHANVIPILKKKVANSTS